jgi:hypothetical protein
LRHLSRYRSLHYTQISGYEQLFFFPLLPQLLGASDQAAPHVIQILECLLVSGLDPSITTLYFRDHSNQ